VVCLEAVYHATAIFEIWLAASLITGAPLSLVTAFVLEFVNRAITIVFQFVPMWIGVDEAGTSLVTGALSLGTPLGVGLALVRRARTIMWTAFGVSLCVASRLSLRSSGSSQLPMDVSAWSAFRRRQAESPSLRHTPR
jgi:hypothetical protein